MKFSMNGFRRNLSGDVKGLREIAQRIINDEYWEKEDLAEAVNSVIAASNVLNCVSNPDDPLFEEMCGNDVEHVGVTP